MGPYNAQKIIKPFNLEEYNKQIKLLQLNNYTTNNYPTNNYPTNDDIPNDDIPNDDIINKKINGNEIIISAYLDKYIRLWIWDFDDTLIDIDAYKRHNMDREKILSLTDNELEFDIPNYKYFKLLVYYLVSSGRRVGIASFSVYFIIRSYMDRIFGFNQKIFTENNIYSMCKDVNIICDGPRNMPINKNLYIQKLMKHYNITNYKEVILFDDSSSNIADASRMGIIPIQIQSLNSINLNNKMQNNIRDNIFLKKKILFGPTIMMNIESNIKNMCNNNPLEYDKQFGQLGDFKIMKQYYRINGEIINNDNIKPNFNIDAFINLSKKKKNTNDILKENKITKINKALEGFENNITDINYDFNCNTSLYNINNNLTGLFKNLSSSLSSSKCNNEGFSSCMSCKSPTNTYFIIIMFIIMIGFIISIFYI